MPHREIEGHMYVGEVKEKEKAKKQYEQAVSSGQTAGLVKYVGQKNVTVWFELGMHNIGFLPISDMPIFSNYIHIFFSSNLPFCFIGRNVYVGPI